ncbi:MAG: VWA domain-containing protein, partial [Chitinophagaceae bacterium]|nr:VWA domain-containing protein [Anaerolineae bacterium]
MKKLLLILILVLFALPTAFVLTQDATPTPVFPLTITGVDATNLPEARITANVFDLFGQPLQGLDVGNFILTGELAEVAQIVRVENITDDNLPFATVLVIDVSSSMSGLPFQQAQEAARVFINSLRENDLVAIVTFSNQAQLVQDYTTDKALLLATIDTLAFGGQTALYDAALTALDVAENAPVTRRAIILLSDGAESNGRGGIISGNSREAAPQAALVRGVPFYTIGLGFGTDRTYLEALSTTTNALFSESPMPDQLPEIYGNLAALLRSQYVITLNVDVPLDGTEYDFTLKATTANGDSPEASSVLRAPIPVPIVRFDNPPTAPITELTTVNALILADDQLTEIVIDDGVRPQNVIPVDT